MANELTVVNENDKQLIMSVLGGKMAQDIEFQSLDSAIEKIAAHTNDLSDVERNSAVDIVSKFERRVINTIDVKERTLANFSKFFKLKVEHMSMGEIAEWLDDYSPQLESLFSREGMGDFGEKLQHVMDEIERVTDIKDDAPDEPLIDRDIMTGLQVHRLELEYTMALSRFNAKIKREEHKVRKEFYELMKAVRRNSEIKKFLKVLDAQQKASEHARGIVEEKAAAARLNIVVGNADIREALKEFHDFASSI